MRHSRLDALLVILLLVQVVLLVLPFAVEISIPALFGLIFLNIFLVGTNFQCIAHNFIHLPFFKSNSHNNIFSALNSLGIGVPQSVYRLHHLNHHRHNNRPEADESSTFRYGKNGQEENIFSYSFLGLARTNIVGLYNQCSKDTNLPLAELLVLVIFLTTMVVLNFKLAIFYLIPSYLGGHFFAMWENYCEHHFSNPYDRKRDSVSCYNKFYNWIWFNNGYHQEHHYSPQIHWTEISKVKETLPADRVIVKGCHLTNSF